MYRYITNKYYQNEIVLLKLLNDKLMYKIIQKYDTETWHLQRAQFNPLHPNISMHILHTVLYTFPKVLTRRIYLTNKSLVGDHFLYSHDLNVWFRGDIVRRN